MDAPTILVVEDDAAVRQGVVDALTFAGYEVLSEADGKSGRDPVIISRLSMIQKSRAL